jgi:protein required for attachment to host cells
VTFSVTVKDEYMEKNWILVANAHRARCFERDGKGGVLNELADFTFPHGRINTGRDAGDPTGEAGKGHGRTAHSGRQFEPRTEFHDKERASFARTLAGYVNDGVAGQRCAALILIASSQMLGDIRPLLSVAAEKVLRNCVDRDLTVYQGTELKERVDHALELPD